MLDGLTRAFTMLKASRIERRRVVLVTHSTKALPAAVVKLAAKFRAAGIETAALGFQNEAFDHLAKFGQETRSTSDSTAPSGIASFAWRWGGFAATTARTDARALAAQRFADELQQINRRLACERECRDDVGDSTDDNSTISSTAA